MSEVTNWFGDLVSHPQAVVEVTSVDDIVAVLKNPAKYPAPVRGIGSNHSTSRCGTADGGTVIKMLGMNRILNIGADSVTAQGGALYIDIAHELKKHNLQFVSVERAVIGRRRARRRRASRRASTGRSASASRPSVRESVSS